MVLTASPPKPDQSEAADRLIRVNILNSVPTTVADTVEFKYNGLGQRVEITEKHGNFVLFKKSFLWAEGAITEERNETGSMVSKRYFNKGFQIVSGNNLGNYFYSMDHLGSIREAMNDTGAVMAKYDYDLWGRQTKLSGTMDADFGFTGFYVSHSTGLDLTWYRAHSPELGRWLSMDPLEEKEGLNRYEYVLNNTVRLIDPKGLCPGYICPDKGPDGFTFLPGKDPCCKTKSWSLMSQQTLNLFVGPRQAPGLNLFGGGLEMALYGCIFISNCNDVWMGGIIESVVNNPSACKNYGKSTLGLNL